MFRARLRDPVFPRRSDGVGYPLGRVFSPAISPLRGGPRPLEVLACPHCGRLFRTNPTVLGKKICCRRCQQIFHVPHDTTHVPLGPAIGDDEALPPVAMAFVKNGRDVRCCPACGRTFAMKPAFAGKTIRCRDCAAPFRVTATVDAPAGPQPTISEDVGVAVGAMLPGEEVALVVRPRNVPRRARSEENVVATMLAIIFGGMCAVPVVLIILHMFAPEQFKQIIRLLPAFLRFGAR